MCPLSYVTSFLFSTHASIALCPFCLCIAVDPEGMENKMKPKRLSAALSKPPKSRTTNMYHRKPLNHSYLFFKTSIVAFLWASLSFKE